MFETTNYEGTALQMLWNAYYHILTSRTESERDTLSILRKHAIREYICVNCHKYYFTRPTRPTPLV